MSVGSGNPLPTLSSTLTTSTSALPLITSAAVTTPTPFEPGMVGGCTAFHLVTSGDNCAAIAADAEIALTDLETWNPSVSADCTGLWLSYYVCIGASSSLSTIPTPTTTLTITITSIGNGVTTPTPYQPGMVGDCVAFHLVISGDGCTAIASRAGITLADFYTWKPTVGSDCAGLWLGYYVCVGLL
ncbi:hypothetical protein BDV09DRAFT_202996 [Aspergillus tetrazonus]